MITMQGVWGGADMHLKVNGVSVVSKQRPVF